MTTERLYTLADLPFAGRTGRGVTVAVLDSGIHADHPHVGGISGGISLVGEPDTVDRIGHGTAVAAAIREKAPGVSLLAVRVFEKRLATNVEVLARAIIWAADNGAALINLSLGTPNPERVDHLADAVTHASARGSIIVSASEANGVRWFPGSMTGVVGVTADYDCDRDSIYVLPRAESNTLPSLRASPYPRPIDGVPRERNLFGVSFAVANVTGFLARAIEGEPLLPLTRLTSLL